VAAVLLYAAMWLGYVQGWSWLSAFDARSLDAVHPIGAEHPGWVTSWNVFCTVLGPTAFRIVGVVVIVRLLTRRYLRAAMFLVVAVELGGLVTQVAKLLVDRPRPATAMVYAFGTSFPSGHALGVMVAVLGLLTIVLPAVRRTWRTPLIVAGTATVILVGVGRVVLNVHHPSDVLAGWAMGYLWYLLWLRVLRPLPLARAGAETPAAPGTEQ
jgi:undecaprenyl-diphosphatase